MMLSMYYSSALNSLLKWCKPCRPVLSISTPFSERTIAHDHKNMALIKSESHDSSRLKHSNFGTTWYLFYDSHSDSWVGFLKWRLLLKRFYLPVGITDQDHLLQQLAIRSGFGHNLPEDQQQLFDGVVLQRENKTDDGHEETWQLLPIQNHDDDFLQGFCLCLDLSLLCNTIFEKNEKENLQ